MLYAIHGFTEDDLAWRDVLEPTHLAHRSLLLPGHGSAPCATDATLPTVASDLAARLPDDASADLMGYSMGGRVALQIALDHPERVRRLVLVSCCPGITDDHEREQRRKQDDALAEILEQDGIGSFVASWESNPTLRPGAKFDSGDENLLRSRRLNQDPDGLACVIRRLGQGRMQPLWNRLGELQMRVLLICASQDSRYRAYMQRMHERIPHSDLHVIPDTGHAVHREDPKALIEATLAFLIRP